MSISICQYRVTSTESSRTHREDIDITLRSTDQINSRTFLSDEQAIALIEQMFKALATPFIADEDVVDATEDTTNG